MKRASFIALSLLLWAGCANRAATHADASALSNSETHAAPQNAATPAAKAEDTEESDEKAIPAAFREVDFKNFSYPISWERRTVRLEGGEREIPDEVSGGVSFDIRNVGYADLTGDGVEEAVVNLSRVSCGGSCDGGSDLFYVYAVRDGRPKLLWRIETGSLGYGCGLKSFAADARGVTIEVFKDCRLEGRNLVEAGEPEVTVFKFGAKRFTRLFFEFEKGTFALKHREVFPSPQEDVKNYSAAVRIGDE